MSEISAKLNRFKSTISREIFRNTGGRGYKHQAHRVTIERHQLSMNILSRIIVQSIFLVFP